MTRCAKVLLLLGVLWCCERGAVCTSAHNLQNLLKHPHYSQGHRHSLQQQSWQNATPHSPRKPQDPFSRPHSTYPTRLKEEPWSRVSTVQKEYYKTNGHHKTTSAAKGPLRRATLPNKGGLVVDPQVAQELSEVREANEHFVRMRTGTRCGVPRAQVVCVRDLYPEKEFLPRCTLLHRCTEASGCCEDEDHRCSPKAVQEVALHFYVLGGDRRSSDVEKLFFVNHTECECRPIPDEDRRPQPSVLNVTATTTTASTTITRTTAASATVEPQSDHHPKCRLCPVPFCARELDDGRGCTCDCFDKHRPCLRIKKGREPFSDSDRRCIETGRCQAPDCEYGPYETDRGRCPRRPDHDVPRRQHPQHFNFRNPNHRWTYFERD